MTGSAAATVDLASPADALAAFLTVRASLDGTDTVTWFRGDLWGWVPGERQQKLLGFEGYNVARVAPADGGYDLLSREAAFYVDPQTGTPIERWTNPLTGEEVDVVHIWNDPVNLPMRAQGQYGPFRLPVTEIGGDAVLAVDVFLTYPSPLPRADYPDNSQSDVYQGAELFHFFCRADALRDPAAVNVPASVSWTRVGPWLPWMRMADRPGFLVYRGQGGKLAGGYDELPTWIRARVETENPSYATAPTEFTSPNETSWTYFKKQTGNSGSAPDLYRARGVILPRKKVVHSPENRCLMVQGTSEVADNSVCLLTSPR